MLLHAGLDFMWCPQDAFDNAAITVNSECCVNDDFKVEETRGYFGS